MSDAIFTKFYEVARKKLTKNYPLLISGGCGLNCSWNSLWRDCGLFPQVFVPPCPDDSGSAIGTAIDAQAHFTGQAKIEWSVYSGAEFILDHGVSDAFEKHSLDLRRTAEILRDGGILAWVQGRCEIGPRALGNRSLLAAPFDVSMRDRLNLIKHRESYRPVAPVCLEEDVSEHFVWNGESPHMLYFAPPDR